MPSHSYDVQCDICFRTGGHGDKKLPFLCPTDARNQLYDSRIQNARILLENDTLGSRISGLLANDKATTSSTTHGFYKVTTLSAERDQAVDRTQQIITQADELRAKVEAARADLAKRKAAVTRRKSGFATVSNGVESRRIRQIEDIEKNIRMNRFKWDQGHAITASSRTFLCGEAAKLYGLKKTKKDTGEEEYKIGGVGIVDLRSLNRSSPAQISTALSHIVHLLMLSTHYLAIRLPAEITLPHRDYPLPTIFPIPSSYKHTDVPFPGITPGTSSNTSPTASRQTEPPNHPHPRPLFIDKPLPLLSTEDPSGYGLFLEGVTLLAYDIAWLCKSQGIPVGGEESSFEDICNLGKNLHNLLIGSKLRPLPGSRAPSTQSTPTKGRDANGDSDSKITIEAPSMGKYSHGTARYSLGGAEGTEMIRTWKILSPVKLAYDLKAKLMTEAANNEWELLNADEWAVENEMGDDGVVVAARREADRNRNLGMQSFMSMRTVGQAVEALGGVSEAKPGTSGWTKLRK